jgi:hypothetical protein
MVLEIQIILFLTEIAEGTKFIKDCLIWVDANLFYHNFFTV